MPTFAPESSSPCPTSIIIVLPVRGIIASTLNENLGAPIVGNKTYGKGLLQKVLHLYNGYTISYTTEEWVTSKKKMVEQVGIEPTIKAENVEGYTSDDYIEKATDSIKKILNNNM